MTSIFISYRRAGTSGYGGRLEGDLRRHFGRDQVFRDVDGIRPGSEFAEVIEQAVRRSSVVLVLIGRTWLNAINKRRLQDPNDFVRLEIESALKQEIVVVPVLVEGAKMPTSAQLPNSISRLSRTQGIELTDERWDYDVSRLISALEELAKPSHDVTADPAATEMHGLPPSTGASDTDRPGGLHEPVAPAATAATHDDAEPTEQGHLRPGPGDPPTASSQPPPDELAVITTTSRLPTTPAPVSHAEPTAKHTAGLSRPWQGVLVIMALVGLVAAVVAISNEDGDQAAPGTTSTSTLARVGPVTTGQTINAGALEGMKGTTPLVDVGADFKSKLDGQGLDLKNIYSYGAESYDAAIVIGLATVLAKSDGMEMAKQINGVTRGGVKCETFKGCSELVKAGTEDIDYDGVSGPLEFSGNGEPTVASYGIQQFGATNRIDDARTTIKTATAPKEADVPQVPVEGTRAGDGTLKIGTLLPVTGVLAFLGPSEVAGVRLAVKEINGAGGVLGRPVELTEGDSGDALNPAVGSETVDRLLGASTDAIIGAASSSVTLNVIDKIVGSGVVMFSPANTLSRLSAYDDNGLYFRTAPSDLFQAHVLAAVVASDNIRTLGLLVLDDTYGKGLAEDLAKSFSSLGGQILDKVFYSSGAQSFEDVIDRIKAKNPAGIVIIGFDETSRLLTLMVEKGIGPKFKQVYGVDGNMSDTLGELFDQGK